MTQDRETEGKKLEKLYDDDKITYAEFEEMTRGLILTPAQDVDRRKRQHWKNRGGWFGYFRRMLIGLIGWMIDCVAIAGGAYIFHWCRILDSIAYTRCRTSLPRYSFRIERRFLMLQIKTFRSRLQEL